MSRPIPPEPPLTLPEVPLPEWCQRGDVEPTCLPPARDGWPEEMPATATGLLAGKHRPSAPGEFGIAVRSYAPFYQFGGPTVAGYHAGKYEGDGRGHSESLGASAREVQWSVVDLNGGGLLSTSCASDPSRGSGQWVHSFWNTTGDGLLDPSQDSDQTLERTAQPECDARDTQGADGSLHLSQHVAGAMPLSRLSPDIDVHTDLQMKMAGDRLHVTGSMKGDQFPNAEVVLTDPRGQTLLVHGYATGGDEMSPFSALPFDDQDPMGSFAVEVILDEEKNFIGVRVAGQEEVHSVEAWNDRLRGQGFKASAPSML